MRKSAPAKFNYDIIFDVICDVNCEVKYDINCEVFCFISCDIKFDINCDKEMSTAYASDGVNSYHYHVSVVILC